MGGGWYVVYNVTPVSPPVSCVPGLEIHRYQVIISLLSLDTISRVFFTQELYLQLTNITTNKISPVQNYCANKSDGK